MACRLQMPQSAAGVAAGASTDEYERAHIIVISVETLEQTNVSMIHIGVRDAGACFTSIIPRYGSDVTLLFYF